MITKNVIKKLLLEKQEQVAHKKSVCNANRNLAFSNDEISSKQSAYTSAKFASLKDGKGLSCKEVVDAKNDYLLALKKYGFDESDFDYVPECNDCNNLGFKDGQLCHCVKDKYISMLAKECDIDRRAPFSFADNMPVNADESHQKALYDFYNLMSQYVDKYPNVKKSTITILGATGTGKSCLASAVARKTVLEKGRSAVIYSAYEFNAKMLECHLSPLEKRTEMLDDILTADLVVIDDLGTEPIYKNVTIEYLQLLLDERMRNNLTTLITTNLDEMQLKARYGERIFSRITDFDKSIFKRIKGKDLRLTK